LPCAKHCPSFGARTGRAVLKGCERRGASRFAFLMLSRWPAAGGAVRLPCAQALPFLWCAHRARTAKQRAHGPMAWPLDIQWRVSSGGFEGGALGAGEAYGRVKWPAIARCVTVLQCAPCARTQGMPLACHRLALHTPCQKNFRLLKNLATGEEKYATILATERRTMPSNGEGMLCHGC